MGRGSSNDNDDDRFIRYGTPLEPLSDDDDDDNNDKSGDVYAKTPKTKKQKREKKEMEAAGVKDKGKHLVQNQIVTDEEGRRRFHGAFSGGFSAGYYNTVGSKVRDRDGGGGLTTRLKRF